MTNTLKDHFARYYVGSIAPLAAKFHKKKTDQQNVVCDMVLF
jgi:hypothetical protein